MRIPLPSLHRPFRLAWHWRGRIAAGLALLPLHAGATLAFPLLVGDLLDGVTGAAGGDTVPPAIGTLCLILLGLAAVEAGARWGSRMLLIGVSRKVEQRLKNDLVAHMTRLPIRWHDQARTGDLLARMTQDVEMLRFLVGPILLHGGSALLVVPVGLTMLLSLSPAVTAICAAALAVLIAGLVLLLPRMRVAGERVQEALGALSQQVQEANAGIQTVQTFAATDRQTAALDRLGRRYLVHNLKLTRLRAGANAVVHGATRGIVLLVVTGGAFAIAGGELSLGGLFTFVLYLGLMLWPIQALGWSLGVLPRALAAGRRIEEVFAEQPEPEPDSAAEEIPLPDPMGEFEVRGLTFRWPGAERDTLSDVTFTLPAGCNLGLVGAVGSGKTTLLELLLRLQDPPPGTLFLDGVDLAALPPEAVRRLFAYAEQEPFLFGDTIAANIHFGQGLEEPIGSLQGAVTTSALDQDLARFPKGLETLLGERGITLSGGQRQRVSLARALHADRPILLLDDVVSALDPITEIRVANGLAALQDRRSIVASHRLSAVRHCGLILVLDQGRIAQSGDHDSLLAQPGPYRDAWLRQREALALEGGLEGGPDPGGRRRGGQTR